MKASADRRVPLIRHLLRALELLLVLGLFGFFLWRILSSGNPREMRGLAVNRAVFDAWTASGGADGGRLTVYRQDQDPITRADHNRGYFSVTDVKFVEEARQVQVLLRYNNSTIRHLKEDFKLDRMPDRSDDLFDVTLYVAYDLTPENADDNDGNDPACVRFERFHPAERSSAARNLYNFRRFIFDGVDMTVRDCPVLAVYADIYYLGDVDYDGKDAYGTLLLYDYRSEKVPYKLSEKDRKNLEGFKG